MTITVIGNHGSAFRTGRGPGGIGAPNQPSSVSWTGLNATEADDTYVIPLDSLGTLKIDQGIFVQSSVEIELEFTLSERGLFADQDPDKWEAALWGNTLVLAPGDIVETNLVFTAVKVKFSGKGQFFIGVH